MKLTEYTIEELANALYVKGEELGISKITDKTKWRELVMANCLGHEVHSKISAGAESDKYGSDAFDTHTAKFAEYKSKAITDKEARNFRGEIKSGGKSYALPTIPGVYNGAFKEGAIEKYRKIDHYFGVFYKETCVLIILVNNKFLTETLSQNKSNQKIGKTTNLNSVVVRLKDVDNYDIVYKNEEWYNK